MAELRGGTTIGGYLAVHTGLKNVRFAGNLLVGLKITSDQIVVGDPETSGTKLLIRQGAGNGLVFEDSDAQDNKFVRVEVNEEMMKFQALNNSGDAWVRDLMLIGLSGNIGIGAVPHTTHKLNVGGDIRASGAVRSTAWVHDTFGGGWEMTDANYVRTYGSKSVQVDNNLLVGTGPSMGVAGTVSIGNRSIDFTPTGSNTTRGAALLITGLYNSTIGFHHYGSRVDYIRVGSGIMTLGYNGGYGNASVRIPGTMVVPVGTDKYAT